MMYDMIPRNILYVVMFFVSLFIIYSNVSIVHKDFVEDDVVYDVVFIYDSQPKTI